MELTTELKNEYLTLWQNCQVNPAYADGVAWYVKQIEKYRGTYESVAQETDVPWFVIAVIHAMESTFKFTRHLHVYMFAGWSDQANHIAWVIDNQNKYRHTRHTNAILGGKSAFHYFLRA